MIQVWRQMQPWSYSNQLYSWHRWKHIELNLHITLDIWSWKSLWLIRLLITILKSSRMYQYQPFLNLYSYTNTELAFTSLMLCANHCWVTTFEEEYSFCLASIVLAGHSKIILQNGLFTNTNFTIDHSSHYDPELNYRIAKSHCDNIFILFTKHIIHRLYRHIQYVSWIYK